MQYLPSGEHKNYGHVVTSNSKHIPVNSFHTGNYACFQVAITHGNTPERFLTPYQHSRGLLHKTFYRRKLWLKLKTLVSTILPLTLTQEKTQVKNNLSFLRLRVLCNRPQITFNWCLFCSSVLHDMKVTHTDLKPENILFVNSSYTIKYDPAKVSGIHQVTHTYSLKVISAGEKITPGLRAISPQKCKKEPSKIKKSPWKSP